MRRAIPLFVTNRMLFKKKIDLRMIDPSSKMALKMSCLQTANGDVKKAQELYAFLSDGMGTMPDYPIQQPSLMQQAQQTIGGVFGWVKDNQNDLMQAWNFIQSMRGGQPMAMPPAAGAVPPVEIPPLPQP